MTSKPHVAGTKAGQLIEHVRDRFAEADLFYGHGTDNAGDEAAALVFSVLELDHADGVAVYDTVATMEQCERIAELAGQRIETRKPLSYLLGEAWFAGIPFNVDERVLVPRSPVAELIASRFEPWAVPARIRLIADIGTGSGCIAAACALAFPGARVVATDISPDALDVARTNVERHGLGERVRLVETDLMDGLATDYAGQFDVIISNPPYVPAAEQPDLPAEYGHEPALGLFSGADGLDSARRILQDAPQLLRPDGILVLEVGAQWAALEQACPQMPFTWLEFEHGGVGVAVLQAADMKSDAAQV
jgi:ribosomal protein L3 glutamine methyltransferase